jgi:hypothetical protein
MLDQPESIKAKKRRPKPNQVPRREVGLNFIVQHQTIEFGGNKHHWPRVHLHEQVGGETRLTSIDILDEYYHDHPRYTDAWRLNAARAVGLFADFAGAKLQTISPEELAAPDEVLERRLLQGFAVALKSGTLVGGADYAADPLGLGWRPRGDRQARVYLSALSKVLEWMGKRTESARWQWISKSTSERSAASSLRVAAELAIRHQKSLLRHLDGTERVPLWHSYAESIITPQKSPTVAVNSFPAKWAAPFLFECFDLEDEAQMTAATVAAVLFCGGLRMSEPFHSYTTDVQLIDGMAHLFFQHPAWGIVSSADGKHVTRKAYLQDFGLQPRNIVHGKHHAGWKGMADDDRMTQAYWLPIAGLRQRVNHLLMRYLTVTRPAIMARRPASALDHPFLFVSARAVCNGSVGDPYTISAFQSAWAAAIKRLSRLLDDPEIRLRKRLGTTVHGARHFFGHFLKVVGVPAEVITRVMNHRDPASQLVYGLLSPFEINDVLEFSMAGADPNVGARTGFLQDVNYFNDMNAKWSAE